MLSGALYAAPLALFSALSRTSFETLKKHLFASDERENQRAAKAGPGKSSSRLGPGTSLTGLAMDFFL